MTTVREALEQAVAQLAAAGCDSPRVDAELLVSHALGLPRTALFAAPERTLDAAADARLAALVARRARREPLAYVLEAWGFRRLTLRCDARALVPRPETEVVVERALARIAEIPEPLVLDVGTGSGAIALAIADEHPGARVVATDISADALALAAENRRRAGLEERVELVLGHLVAGLRGPFDLVVSNPPYVRPEEFERLPPEVRLYEPREALVGAQGPTVARRALDVLRPGGWLVLECGDGQAAALEAQLAALGYVERSAFRDLAGRERGVEARRR